jgi:hypothetical protein
MPSISGSFYETCLEQWRQGDILTNFNNGDEKISLAVLATPQCDIYWEKAEYFLFVPAGDFVTSFLKIIDPNGNLDADFRDGVTELSKNKLGDIFNHIIRHLNGDYGHRFYYLPPYSTGEMQFNKSYLDFQKIFTLSQEKCETLKTTRIGTLCDPFRAQIFTRCVSYLGRIGTSDFTREDVYSLLENSNLKFRTEHLDELWQKRFRLVPVENR